MKRLSSRRFIRKVIPFFGVSIILLNITAGLNLTQKVLPSLASAAGCNSISAPGPGIRLSICLVDPSGNLLSDPSNYNVTVTQTYAPGHTATYTTTYYQGTYVTQPMTHGLGTQSQTCTGPSAELYQLEIYAKKNGDTYKNAYNACNDQSRSTTYLANVTVTPGKQPQYGSISGCITYTAQDGTTQKFNGSSNITNPASATLVGPNGSATSTPVTINSDGCLTVNNLPVGQYTLRAQYSPDGANGQLLTENYQDVFTVTAGKTTQIGGQASTKESSPITTGQTNNQTSSSDPTPSCASGFSLSWLFCSVISGAAKFVQNAYLNIINPILDQPQSSVILDTSKPYYSVWANFRIFGDVFLIIALLVVVFGESIGGGLIDAYSAKKILPRLLTAAVLINLSIYLIAIALDVTSVFGHGIYSLLVWPFDKSLHGFTLHLSLTGNLLTALAAGAGAIWVSVAGGGFLHFLFVTVLGGAVLILFATMTTLILRIALILGLLFVAPVAFALYCLPNTEKYFRKWWDLLSRALLVYPLVGAIFALANITSWTLGNLPLTGLAKGFGDVFALIGLFVPLILVPFVFKLAGGAIGTLHDGIGGRMHQGGMRGISAIRNQRRQSIHQQRMSGEMSKGRFGDAYRRVHTGLTVPHSGAFTSNAQYRSTKERLLAAQRDELLKRPGVNEALMDDNVRGVLAVGEDKARDFLVQKNVKTKEEQDVVIAAARSVGFSPTARLAALQGESTHGKGRNMAAISTVYGSPGDANKGLDSLIKDIQTTNGLDDTGVRRLKDQTEYNFRTNGGRGDLGQDSVSDFVDKKFDGQTISTITDAGMAVVGNEWKQRITSTDPVKRQQVAAQLLATTETMSRMLEPTRVEFVKQMKSMGVDFESSEPVDVQLAKMASGPSVATSYNATIGAVRQAQSGVRAAQQAIDTAVAEHGTGSPEAQAQVAALSAAQASLAAAQKAHAPYEEIIGRATREIRGTSSTYSQSVPMAERTV